MNDSETPIPSSVSAAPVPASKEHDHKAISSPVSHTFIYRHPAYFLACGLGTGLAAHAPGTMGTLLAWGVFFFLERGLSDIQIFYVVALALIGGVYLCGKTGRALGTIDHAAIVWDEIAAFWLVLFFTPSGVGWQLLAFALFRFFDIAKPAPIQQVEMRLQNGFGVMADDVAAALYTLVILAIVYRYV